jgi:drug/metabolite transporter (DMT)-like permease
VTLGIILAIAASAAFGFNGASVRRGVASGRASQGLYITIYFGLVMFIVASLVSGQIFKAGDMSTRDYEYLAAGGFFHILAGRYCNYRAIAALGANRAGPIVGVSTLMSVLIAVVFLDEAVNAVKGVGVVLVMIGPALVAPSRQPAPVAAPSGASGTAPVAAPVFTPKIAEGYLFGALAAGLWGAGPVLMRAGLDTTELGIWGGTVAYATAAVVLLFALIIPGQASGVISMNRDAKIWFTVSSVNSFVANGFRFSALALAPVSVVIPLMRTAVVFQLGFNYLINRQIESFEPKVLGGIFVSLVGAVLLVI